jgi:hypothetical protein
VLIADFGVSHRLSAFAAGDTHKTASKVPTVLTGTAALGPLQVRLCRSWSDPLWRRHHAIRCCVYLARAVATGCVLLCASRCR